MSLMAGEIQDRWLSHPAQGLEGEDMADLYTVLVNLARALVISILNKKKLVMDDEDVREKAHLSTMLLLELMEKKRSKGETYYVRNFKSRLYLDCLGILFHPHRQDYKMGGEEEISTLNPIDEKIEKKTPQEIWDSILTYPFGRRVVIIIFNETYYKRAILKIEPITGRQWIYDHAVELHTLHKYTRLPK